MKILSNNLCEGGYIPMRYSCEGDNISPQLTFAEFPPETKSFALTMEDPDAPGATYTHWIVGNIPKDKTEIAEGEGKIIGAKTLANDEGNEEYDGPCPPQGEDHNYVFTLYALDTEEINDLRRDNFFEMIGPHTIDKVEMTVKYRAE